MDFKIKLPEPHPKQWDFIGSEAKRKMIRAGRRGGKTVGVAILAVLLFLQGRRILYATPTAEQIQRFWVEVTRALHEPIVAKVLHKNETMHIIERPGSENRIRAKTAWNADTLRGDYADVLILDEFQLMAEETWGVVGAPMLLDNNGDAVFVYTPPSLHSRSTSKATDPQHAAKMFKKFLAEEKAGNPRYKTFHFKSTENPHLSTEALAEIAQDMTNLAYRMEILAEDVDEAPGALWTRQTIEKSRVSLFPDLARIVVSVDPSATSTGDEAGIIVGGLAEEQGYLLADNSLQGSPLAWAKAAIAAFHIHKADHITAESNQGGEMVSTVIGQVDPDVPVKLVHASRGKMTRAEPVAAKYEQGKIHHVGTFAQLEDEMALWIPGDPSPNRMDAMVWAFSDLFNLGDAATDGIIKWLGDQKSVVFERRKPADEGRKYVPPPQPMARPVDLYFAARRKLAEEREKRGQP